MSAEGMPIIGEEVAVMASQIAADFLDSRGFKGFRVSLQTIGGQPALVIELSPIPRLRFFSVFETFVLKMLRDRFADREGLPVLRVYWRAAPSNVED